MSTEQLLSAVVLAAIGAFGVLWRAYAKTVAAWQRCEQERRKVLEARLKEFDKLRELAGNGNEGGGESEG